jgi:hypothetical protein
MQAAESKLVFSFSIHRRMVSILIEKCTIAVIRDGYSFIAAV